MLVNFAKTINGHLHYKGFTKYLRLLKSPRWHVIYENPLVGF